MWGGGSRGEVQRGRLTRDSTRNSGRWPADSRGQGTRFGLHAAPPGGGTGPRGDRTRCPYRLPAGASTSSRARWGRRRGALRRARHVTADELAELVCQETFCIGNLTCVGQITACDAGSSYAWAKVIPAATPRQRHASSPMSLSLCSPRRGGSSAVCSRIGEARTRAGSTKRIGPRDHPLADEPAARTDERVRGAAPRGRSSTSTGGGRSDGGVSPARQLQT
ncbi:MAG: hypothetical protein BIP78_1187 [Candidatus Bipolaricaulis sibiricus]|uniref:Uncharacterized protein n=1 Tax=Bipolaricaulis sibiricus TaxID=2501609 RepID=A0A410FV95_BIPS1|nr:MAG: hypothetical protein BIP78_1187 [Candidatus Bipolaricaulis sibiricus]